MELVASSGGIVVVHAEDDDLVQFNYELFTLDGRTAGTNLHHVHSKLSEHLSFARTILLASAKRAALYFVHTSASEGVSAIEEARAAGQVVYGETLHQYLCHTADEYAEPGGFRFHTYPSVKLQEDQDALWRGLLAGSLSTVATDEFPTTRDVKLMGSSIEDVTGGNLGAEARMGIVYTEGVSKRGMSLRRFVDVTSTNAAKIFGLYPRKGVIAIGSDADLTLMDTRQSRRLTMADFHVADYSPWEGWQISAWPTTTISKGRVITSNGALLGKPGDGEWLERKIDPHVVQRLAC
jgi:dihydropyrimidinase